MTVNNAEIIPQIRVIPNIRLGKKSCAFKKELHFEQFFFRNPRWRPKGAFEGHI